MYLPDLFRDLTIILITAGIVSIIFHWLKQPVVLGYLLGGILVGPHVPFTPTILDTTNVQVWAELGVILLLFLLGIEFNFKKLLQVGKSAIIIASFEVLFMTVLGFITGKLLGWDYNSSLFLGFILSISSTTIIIKAFDDLELKSQPFAKLVFGILIIEDLLAVIILIALSILITDQELTPIFWVKKFSFFGLLIFMIVPFGLWATPRFFKFIKPILNDEVRVIVSLGLCLVLVMVASALGFSSALGAFLMGAFLGESDEAAKSIRYLKPIRDLFGAIFFTSVGTLVDIYLVYSEVWLVLLLSAITIMGKVFSTAGGAMISRKDKNTAFQVGLSLGQIGEFSFIIATLGLNNNVIRKDLYPLTVAIALITTFATPYLVMVANKIGIK